MLTHDERVGEPLYRIPPGSLTLTSLAPLLGAARAVFRTTLHKPSSAASRWPCPSIAA
ncbi:hypothetical protein [Streptomyces sp. NPDC052015]|uniref:hypothetical protein n=1 Tax=Streptomyces sp. NPDC052015 TaxID=3154755 RepID=UPI00342C723D